MNAHSAARHDEWEGRYQSGQTGWDRGRPSPALTHWLDAGTLEPCRILVPGCGRGHEVTELARHGFSVTAVDIASSAVTHLRDRLAGTDLSAEIVQADLLHWEPSEPFPAVYEQTCLCALQPAHWAEYEQMLHRWIEPGGRLFALFMHTGQAGGPPFDCALAAMRRLFEPSRWAWQAPEPHTVPHRNGYYEIPCVLGRRDGSR